MPEVTGPTPVENMKVGDVVHAKHQFLDLYVIVSKIERIGLFPNLFLPKGQTVWGATFSFPTRVIDPETGDIIPGIAESSAMPAEFFTWNEAEQRWDCVYW